MTEITGQITSKKGEALLKMWKSCTQFSQRPRIFHSHTQFEIMLVLNGDGAYRVGEKEYDFSKDDIFVFTSNEAHYITKTGDEGIEILNLHFEPRYLFGSSKDSLSEENISVCFVHNADFENKITSEKIKGYLLGIKAELESGFAESDLVIKSLLNMIIVSLIREHGIAEETKTSRSHIYSVRRAMEYIEEHFTESITLEEISKKCEMSPNYLSAVFKRIVGISLWDYILSKRIGYALELLSLPERENILETALKCGFNNTANFNKFFKKQVGTTPSQYRSKSQLLKN
jgi:AraC-like DNA-binding protein/mannose-6-phosphate isomerase-like protein (cupin superfamily)